MITSVVNKTSDNFTVLPLQRSMLLRRYGGHYKQQTPNTGMAAPQTILPKKISSPTKVREEAQVLVKKAGRHTYKRRNDGPTKIGAQKNLLSSESERGGAGFGEESGPPHLQT